MPPKRKRNAPSELKKKKKLKKVVYTGMINPVGSTEIETIRRAVPDVLIHDLFNIVWGYYHCEYSMEGSLSLVPNVLNGYKGNGWNVFEQMSVVIGNGEASIDGLFDIFRASARQCRINPDHHDTAVMHQYIADNVQSLLDTAWSLGISGIREPRTLERLNETGKTVQRIRGCAVGSKVRWRFINTSRPYGECGTVVELPTRENSMYTVQFPKKLKAIACADLELAV